MGNDPVFFFCLPQMAPSVGKSSKVPLQISELWLVLGLVDHCNLLVLSIEIISLISNIGGIKMWPILIVREHLPFILNEPGNMRRLIIHMMKKFIT